MFAAEMGSIYGLTAAYVAFSYVSTLVVAVLQIIAYWKIFAKAGEPGWKSIVPIYNGHVLYRLFWKPVYFWLTLIFSMIMSVLAAVLMVLAAADAAGLNGFTLVSLLVCLVLAVIVLVWSIRFYLKLSRCFGHGGAFAAGLIFLPTIFLLILAFGKDVYLGNPPGCCRTGEEQPL